VTLGNVVVVVVVVVVVIVVVFSIAKLPSTISVILFKDFEEVDVTEGLVLISSVFIKVVVVVEGDDVENDVCVPKVALVGIEETVVVLEMVELVVRSVGLKCGLVYSLSFENLFNLLAMGSLKARLVNPRPSYSSTLTFDRPSSINS
jgi:hypothetical protein